MKPRAHSYLFTLCIAALVLIATSALVAQLADIPLKPGLWETHVIVKMGPNDTDNAPVVSQSCFTAGTTLSQYLEATNKGAPGVKCNVTNKVQTARRTAYDAACTSTAGIHSNAHLDFQLTDAEHVSGTSRATVSGSAGGKPINMEIDKTFTAKFLSAACGNVQPLVVSPGAK